MTIILMSIKDIWWDKIKSGEKTDELRKTRPIKEGPYRVLFYVSGTAHIAGECVVDSIRKTNVNMLESDTTVRHCVPSAELQSYVDVNRYKPLFSWHIEEKTLQVYKNPIPINKYCKRPPQSWQYIENRITKEQDYGKK